MRDRIEAPRGTCEVPPQTPTRATVEDLQELLGGTLAMGRGAKATEALRSASCAATR